MRTVLWTTMLAGLLANAGCADPQADKRLADVELKVASLEEDLDAAKKEIEELKSRPAARPAPAAAPAKKAEGPPATAEEEDAASEAFKEIQDLIAEMKIAEAKEKGADLCGKHPTSRGCKSYDKIYAELQVFGRDAGDMDVEKWFTSPTSMEEGNATLIVFWEVWCPHCKREVPKIQATWDKYGSQGLNVVGVTKINKSATEESVTEFVAEQGLTYHIGKETGTMSRNFNVSGIPAAAVVKDGKIVWRGHPARLTDEMIEAWL